VLSGATQLGYLVGASLIPGQHDVEQIAVDGNEADVVTGACRNAARKHGRHRVTRKIAATLYLANDFALIHEFESARYDVYRAFFGLALFE
jgi:hypothetical protein